MSSSLLNIGISGLQTYQRHLATTGHNIANANTEGYTRQEVVTHSKNGQDLGYGFMGNGVEITQIRRIADEFITAEIRDSTQQFNSLASYETNIEQIDRLMADDRTGLTPALAAFFASAQSAADNPAYIPTREVFIGQANTLADRFNAIQHKLESQNTVINGQLNALTDEINVLAQGIAQLNQDIAFSTGDINYKAPNDLLDRRDELVRELSEKIDIEVTEHEGVYDISIGNGQSLVLKFDVGRLETVAGETDPFRKDIVFISPTERTNLTEKISGGLLGGLLSFRSEILDTSLNALGRVAIGISWEINEQHRLGLDLDGNFGQDIFQDLNATELTRDRVQASSDNSLPNDRVLNVAITDNTLLTTSDYLLKLTGPKDFEYKIIRLSDDTTVKEGAFSGNFPESIEFEGLKLTLEKGSFQAKDEFRIQPLRNAAAQFKAVIEHPAELALAMPVKANTSLGNQGTGEIDQGLMISKDTAMFQNGDSLTPPLVIVFEDDNRYSILDNSDPLNPTSLNPPLEHLNFIPGVSNQIFPEDDGSTLLSSFRGGLPVRPFLQRETDPTETPTNGFNPERIYITRTDPNSGIVTQDPVLSLDGGLSTNEVAAKLNTISGVSARATSQAILTNFTSGTPPYSPANPMDIYINGVEITLNSLGESQNLFEQGYDDIVPDPMTADFVASRINDNFELQTAGFTAKSDGESVTIFQKDGMDIEIEMKGDRSDPSLSIPGDSFAVGNGEEIKLTNIASSTRGLLSDNVGFDFDNNGPYIFEFNLPSYGVKQIELTGAFATGEDVIQEINDKIKSQIPFPADLKVQLNAKGDISFQTFQTLNGWSTNDSEKITIGGKLDVVLEDGISMQTEPPFGNLFSGTPEALPIFSGFQFNISGHPKEGDRFTIDFNSDGSSDNRNALQMVAIELKDVLNKQNGGQTINESYAELVSRVGSRTRQIQINKDAALAVLAQNTEDRDSISGVNLDEEAAKLIRFETAYNAAAQVIKIAQSLFDTLMSTFR
ncbi:MAG: flagellar hook-associated protein FlgK [Saccharospirillaceae bacterium]|nr:flagellar hook-associated protein FlgK [Pseudomonadales bacterium]NRB80188.1 flagellar hook-associated protein FlgK [Saccharospirillaceae bacterium]